MSTLPSPRYRKLHYFTAFNDANQTTLPWNHNNMTHPSPILLPTATLLSVALIFATVPLYNLSVSVMPDNSCSYHCGTCNIPVTWSQAGIVCETCGQWFHAACQSVGSTSYGELGKSDVMWHCIICDNENQSRVVYDLYGLDGTGVETSISSIQSDKCFHPLHSSTPTRASQQNKKRSRPLRMLNVNFRSVVGKRAEIHNLLESLKPDVIIGTETWLDSTIADTEFLPPSYKAFRRDRNREGGGVLIAVSDSIECTVERELNTD
eukprot:TRINITY_DN9988_c0_g2_i1.p1 TRINITY_DN9988_c0_g2~~TRINITY_DN9988_c0_g2_i1.p1  ORF type:complete len:264 (+),score=32.88 TRINITY_DN9988_c0_g2_i1:50-841(+)